MAEPMVTVFELPLSVYKAARLYKQADAARGRWKRVAVQQRRTIKALERDARELRLEVAELGREIERLKAERERAVADLEPMQRAESAALDEVVRLERLLEGKTGRPDASPLPNTDGGASQTPPTLSATRPQAY